MTRTRKSNPLNLPGSATEDQFHLAVAELLDVCLIPPTLYTTFPAGYGKLSKATAGKLRAKGMKPGFPDILVFDRRRVVGLELKVGKGTLSAKQREMHARLQAVGIRVYVIRHLNDVIMSLADAGIHYRNITIPKDRTEVQPTQQVLL